MRKSPIRTILIQSFSLFIVLYCLAGCAGNKTLVTYVGERLPPEQIATIDISNHSLYVMRIDTLKRRYEAFTESRIEVTPGVHTLDVHYASWKGRSDEPTELTFTALAGHSYKILVAAGYHLWSAWIIDQKDGSIVAGAPPR